MLPQIPLPRTAYQSYPYFEPGLTSARPALIPVLPLSCNPCATCPSANVFSCLLIVQNHWGSSSSRLTCSLAELNSILELSCPYSQRILVLVLSNHSQSIFACVLNALYGHTHSGSSTRVRSRRRREQAPRSMVHWAAGWR